MAHVTSVLVDRVVNGPIALWLLRLIVSIVAAIVMRLAIGSVLRMHLRGGMVVITCGSSCKILQVSNYYTIKGLSDRVAYGTMDRMPGITHLCRSASCNHQPDHHAGQESEALSRRHESRWEVRAGSAIEGQARGLLTLTCFFRS